MGLFVDLGPYYLFLAKNYHLSSCEWLNILKGDVQSE